MKREEKKEKGRKGKVRKDDNLPAVKPLVPHPGLFPDVISVIAPEKAAEYKAGLMNPTGALPAACLASLIKVIKLPITGDEAEVPKTR